MVVACTRSRGGSGRGATAASGGSLGRRRRREEAAVCTGRGVRATTSSVLVRQVDLEAASTRDLARVPYEGEADGEREQRAAAEEEERSREGGLGHGRMAKKTAARSSGLVRARGRRRRARVRLAPSEASLGFVFAGLFAHVGLPNETCFNWL